MSRFTPKLSYAGFLISDFSSSKGDVSPSDNGDDVGGRSRDRRPFYGHLPLPTLSTRGRSSERSGTPSAVKKPLENGSVEDKDAPSIRTILERRARDNSASRTSLTGPLLVESPTAVAIARIKAEIGLGGKSNGSNGASVHSLDMSLDVCRNQCRNLTIAVDRIVNDLRNVSFIIGSACIGILSARLSGLKFGQPRLNRRRRITLI